MKKLFVLTLIVGFSSILDANQNSQQKELKKELKKDLKALQENEQNIIQLYLKLFGNFPLQEKLEECLVNSEACREVDTFNEHYIRFKKNSPIIREKLMAELNSKYLEKFNISFEEIRKQQQVAELMMIQEAQRKAQEVHEQRQKPPTRRPAPRRTPNLINP